VSPPSYALRVRRGEAVKAEHMHDIYSCWDKVQRADSCEKELLTQPTSEVFVKSCCRVLHRWRTAYYFSVPRTTQFLLRMVLFEYDSSSCTTTVRIRVYYKNIHELDLHIEIIITVKTTFQYPANRAAFMAIGLLRPRIKQKANG
jgi:hypothetical protein